jgi:hypothetical protein
MKVHELCSGAGPICLPGRENNWHLLVKSFRKEPLLLVTNLLGVRDSQALWWIVQIYLTQWKIEATFRFVKHSS